MKPDAQISIKDYRKKILSLRSGRGPGVKCFFPSHVFPARAGELKGDLLRDPLRLPIFKKIKSLACHNSNAPGVGCANLAPFAADLVEKVFTCSRLIRFLNDDGRVDVSFCAARRVADSFI